MTHNELQKLVLGQAEPEGYTIWCTTEDKTANAAYSRDSVAPELYDAMSAMPVLYQELTRQQKTCQAFIDLVDTAEMQLQKGGVATIDINALRATMQAMIDGMQKAQMVAQFGVSKYADLYTQELKGKLKK